MDSRKQFFLMMGTAPTRAPILLQSTNIVSLESFSLPTWDEARSATNSGINDGRSNAKAIFTTFYKVYRAFPLFDFSVVSGNVIKAELMIREDAGTTLGNNIIAQFCSKTGTIVDSDFTNFSGDYGNGGVVEYIEFSGTTSPMKVITINASGLAEINLKRLTRFCIRDYNNDFLNVAPISGQQTGVIFPAYIRLTTN